MSLHRRLVLRFLVFFLLSFLRLYCNKQYLNEYVDWGNSTRDMMDILTDPQSSGGLVVATNKPYEYIEMVPESTIIGYVVDKERYNITVI